MSAQAFTNTFEGGLNTDIALSNIQNNSYFDSNNISLVNDGKFTSLQNIKGTTQVASLVGATNTEILGVFKNFYQIGTAQNVECLTVFKATTGGTFNIYAIDLNNGTVYSLYQETTPAGYMTSDRVVDGVSYAERGFDILFVTDFYNEPRKIRCVIPSVYTPNFLKKTEIGLQKRKAIGDISLVNITTGGSLLTGSYQVAYQLINPTTNKYTAFSLLTNPIHVYTSLPNGLVVSGVGLPSTKKIVLNITPTSDELANYTHFRLAIVENTVPEGTQGLQVDVGKIEQISTYLSSGVITNYELVSNGNRDTVSLDEITIDLAAIDRVKTLEIVDNRLLTGNVVYKNLTYNHPNGNPTHSGSTLIRQAGTADSFSSDLFTSRYKGMFRDEVYRYAISYFDEFGNFSNPLVLDLSSVTGNKITAGLKDLKTPKRYGDSGLYTLMDSSNNTQSIGLRLSNIINHPTWAKGFVILRAKRKKDIVFQSPFLPMPSVFMPGPLEKYPAIYTTPNTGDVNSTATPVGPNTVYVAPNLFSGGHLNLIRDNNSWMSGGFFHLLNQTIPDNPLFSGTAFGKTPVFMVFPDATMYTVNSKITLNGNEKIQPVDSAVCRFYLNRFDAYTRAVQLTGLSTVSLNMDINKSEDSSVSGSFFASRNNDYYYNYGNSKTNVLESYFTVRGASDTIQGFTSIDNYSSGAFLSGYNISDYDKLTTNGVQFGYKPNSLRSGFITLDKPIKPLVDYDPLLPHSSGTPENIYATSNYDSHAPSGYSAPKIDIASVGSSDVSFSTNGGLYSNLVNMIEIVNIRRGLSDNRYGNDSDFSEYIYTGTKVVFSDIELNTVTSAGSLPKTVDVWGGDCIVSPHTFKVSDSIYTLAGFISYKNEPLFIPPNYAYLDAVKTNRKFNKAYLWLTSLPGVVNSIGIPIAVKNAAQYLTVVLESEYHGSVRDIENLDVVGTYNFPIKGSTTESKLRTPLTYRYNGLEKQNDQKIFSSVDTTQPVISSYKARLNYSNQKVYQTNIEGFDTFPVGNIYDLQERFGGITKLSFVANNLVGLQESAVAYIPVSERILELSDTSQLSVSTGSLFNPPNYLNVKFGCQHLRSVVNDGDSLFFVDGINKSVLALQGSNLADITGNVNTRFRSIFTSQIPEKDIVGVYDPIKNEYWIAKKDGAFCIVYNIPFKVWVSNITFPTGFSGGTYFKNNLNVIGMNSGNFSAETMYTGNPTQFFGSYASTVNTSFSVNPVSNYGKVFDDILISSSDKLLSVDFTVERDASLGNQVVSGINIDVTSRGEGNYRAKILRGSNNERLRGLFSKITLNWKTGVGNPQVSVYSTTTKFRPSEAVF